MKPIDALPILLFWLGLAGTAPLVTAQAQAPQGAAGRGPNTGIRDLRHARLNGIVSSTSLSNINQNDARAAIKVWFDMVAQRKGFLLDSKVDILDSAAEIRERLQNHSVELLIISIAEYLELESSQLVVAALTHGISVQGGSLYSYVLLVKPALGATTLAGLRGKNILVFSRGGSKTGTAWMDVSLGKEKLGRAASFFASVKAVDKAQACILPLFFGTVDACVVDDVNLSLAKEMNPQLGQLRVLARSRPMIGSVIATPVEPSLFQNELLDTILSLHEDARGRQLLMVFKTDRVVRVPPGDLDSARELWRNYYRLAPPNRPVGSATATAAESGQADRGKERDGRYALSGNFHGVVAARHGGRVDLAMPGGAGVGCCGWGGPGTARHSGQGPEHREQRTPSGAPLWGGEQQDVQQREPRRRARRAQSLVQRGGASERLCAGLQDGHCRQRGGDPGAAAEPHRGPGHAGRPRLPGTGKQPPERAGSDARP